MDFFEFSTTYDIIKRLAKQQGLKVQPLDTFYSNLWNSVNMLAPNSVQLSFGQDQWILEYEWIKGNRPYYLLFPKIVPYLARFNEEKVKTDDVNSPLPIIVFRFPKTDKVFEFQDNGNSYCLQSAIIGDTITRLGRALSIFMDFGERAPNGGPILTFRHIVMKPGILINEALNILESHPSINQGVQIPPDVIMATIRAVCACFLLSADKEDMLIEPDVLSDDRYKWDENQDEKLVEKAKRHGKFGWTVGRTLNIAPHYRGPSPLALYWTGKGHAIPRYRYRKGCVVHKEIVKKIPSGFEKEKT